MDSSLALTGSQFSGSISYQKASIQFSKDSLVIERTLFQANTDSVDVAVDDLYKSLQIKAQKIVEKLNELLKAKVPNGVASLSPEEVTPDATAERIVSGATSMFEAYAKSNPDLQGEELLNRFMTAVRKGVDQGYGDAVEILEGLGAFEIDGVKSGVEATKKLIEEKLQAFEAAKRKELGIDPTQDQVAQTTTQEILKQSGKGISLVA